MYPSAPGQYPPEKYAADQMPPSPGIIPNHALCTPRAQVPVVAGRWSTGLCHCCDDPAITCSSSGVIYGLLLASGLACLYSCNYRSKLRGQYDLEESPFVDCLVHFCCETCELCQEYRELKNRGFDLAIGWEANLRRQQRGITVAPIVAPPMTR